MKVLLVDNLVMPEEGSLELLDVHPHLGLLSLAAVAEADGHTLKVYDPNRLIKWGKLPYDSTLYERAALELLAERPQAIGFTALGCSLLFALNVASVIKRHRPNYPFYWAARTRRCCTGRSSSASLSSTSSFDMKRMRSSPPSSQISNTGALRKSQA
jgi:hypothetical protein